MSWKTWVENIGIAIDIFGVAVMVAGLAFVCLQAVRRLIRHERAIDDYRTLRRDTGRAIILGLEFLVAGDIIRTVATNPTFEEVGVLAAIVLIRTWLSFTMELEISGRWPWQPPRPNTEQL